MLSAWDCKMAAVPRFRLKQTPVDVWSTKERLCLASSVMRSGDQNWMSVSRALRPYGEQNRPADWFSQKNCALQYSDLLEKVETPKRKRGERSEIHTPGECIIRKLTLERIEELKKLIIEEQREFYRLKEEVEHVVSGEADNKLKDIWQTVLEERRLAEEKVENHNKWLAEREAAKQAAELEMRKRKILISAKPSPIKRTNSKQGSETEADSGGEIPVADSTIPDVIKEEPSSTYEVGNTISSSNFISSVIATAISSVSTAISMPSPTVSTSHHHSPLLNTLLRSSTHVSQSTLSSPKDSIVTSPTISSLLSSAALVTSSSPSVANLLTTALSGLHDNHDTQPSTTRSPVTSPSQGAPTLLKLLDMPLGAPGKLPPLPVFNSNLEEIIPSNPLIPPSTPLKELNAIKEEKLTVKIEEHIDDVIIVPQSETVIESSVEIENPNVESDEIVVTETVVEEKPISKDFAANDDSVVEVTVAQEIINKEEPTEIIDVQEEVCTEITTSNEVDNIEPDVIEEPTSSTIDIDYSAADNSVMVASVDVTSEDVITTTNESFTSVEELVVETESEVATEVETSESKEVAIVDEKSVEIAFPPAPVLTTKAEPSFEKSDFAEEVSNKTINEDSISDQSIDVVEESVVDEKDQDAKEISLNESGTNDDSESPNKPDEKSPRRRSRTKKWALGKSDRVARRTTTRSTATVNEVPQPEAKVEHQNSDQNISKKSQKIESTETPKHKRDSSNDEHDSKHASRRRRSAGRPSTDTNSERKGRNRRHFKQVEKNKSEDDETVDERKSKDAEKVDKKSEVNEDAKDKIGKDDNATDGNSETTNIETEEESKEGITGRSSFPMDSVPNSPASTSFSGDDVESIRDYKVWKKAIMLVWRSVANHKYANVFLNAVTEEMAPGYQSVVYRPMDLNTVKKSIENQTVRTTTEFQRDVLLIFQNAIMYNSSDHDVYKMAVEMQQEVIGHIQDFVATQLMVQSNSLSKSLRRETRDHALKTRESMEKSLLSIIQDNEIKRKRPASEGDSGSTPVLKRRRTRANDD